MDLQKELENLGLTEPLEVETSVSNDILFIAVKKEEDEDCLELEMVFRKVTESKIKEILKALENLIK